MKISKRAIEIQASPIRKLAPYAEAARAKGIRVFHLNIGQPDIETPTEILDVYRHFDKKVLAYGPSQGLHVYRESLVRYYNKHKIPINQDEIIITTAGSEAIIFALLATCNPGDEVIVPEPFYTNYNGFATIAGVTIKPLTTYAEQGFALPSIKEIEELISEKTRAILFSNPGNPTGAVYLKEDLERLAAVAQKYNLYLISDEVYREFVYDGLSHTSILHINGIEDRAILVDSISKRYSACGARVGCFITRNHELYEGVLKFAQARLCPPTIDQLAANAAVSIEDEYFHSVLKEYDKRRNIVYNEVHKIQDVVCVKPQGAFYVIVKLPISDTEDFARWMLEEFSYEQETVMFAPAQGFYATPGMGRDEVRLAYILNEESLKRAMFLFRKGLEEYNYYKKY
ncbi:MAG TPA: pyridoxal phosphate-dependent aminotransferase [Candidatus Cloacimonetes bacterium]|nr:pyridoxal phosphate-dependent aminotransferase [Candidatus Cloacimonadota bacterium]HEX37938.1 pyridoxal phosphate-dependent aminotransferase [Candidatus Cloacimonadota bacterium]